MPRIDVNPSLTPDQLLAYYQRNGICEAAYGRDGAARVLASPHLIVAAIDDGQLVGLARATSDGLSAHVMELSLDLGWQGDTQYGNGSLVEADPRGLGAALGRRLLDELRSQGIDFVSCTIVQDCEEPVYSSMGFRHNHGHLAFYIDERPYSQDGG